MLVNQQKYKILHINLSDLIGYLLKQEIVKFDMEGEYKSSELVDYEEKMADEIKTNKMLRWYVLNYEVVYKRKSSEDLGKYNQSSSKRSDLFYMDI